jgi:DNA-binding IclR family transcriptional regulator
MPADQRKHVEGSGGRLLSVLQLFTVDRPEWTVETAAEHIGVSATTAYRYFKHLTNAGLITPVSGANYALGPAIIQLDRQIQICDPMLTVARGVMIDLIKYAGEGAIILLCRLFHDRVMCVHQVVGRGPQEPVSYERGRLMPLYRGATSKMILAHLPTRKLRSVFAQDSEQIASAGLGQNWEEFRAKLAALRQAGVAISRGEIDPGRVGVAAPIFDRDHTILGSLSFVLSSKHVDETLIGRLAPLISAGANEIEDAMNDRSASSRPSSARIRMAK